MFANKTVFILGAGASWHYGYPTGEDLIKNVIAKARIAVEYFTSVLKNPGLKGVFSGPKYISRDSPGSLSYSTITEWKTGWETDWERAINECTDLISRLKAVDPLVIDYFLGQNPHLGDIGKFLIAWVLLECEAVYIRYGFNNNRRELLVRQCGGNKNVTALTISNLQQQCNDNWYRFLIHKLVTGCPDAKSLLNNKVTFITFNYDVSLEYQLWRGLSALQQFSGKDTSRRLFFEGNRFIHIYGKVREDAIAEPAPFNLGLFGGDLLGPQPEPNSATYSDDIESFFDTIYEASKGIRTIAPHEKTVEAAVECARRAIAEANCVYILGYGFDENNSSLLDLQKSLELQNTNETVLFTNFGDHNRVNKKASRVFFGNLRPDWLLSDKPAISGDHSGSYFCEKSSRNVYDALAFDFDAPEEQLL